LWDELVRIVSGNSGRKCLCPCSLTHPKTHYFELLNAVLLIEWSTVLAK
jgi:hypothetical protein